MDTERGTGVCCHAPDSPTCTGKAWLPSHPHIPWSLQLDTATLCVIHGARGMFSCPALASVPCIAACESKWDSLTQYISHAMTEHIPSTPLISGGNDRNQTPGGDPLTTLTSSNRQFSQPSIRSLPLDKMNPILSKIMIK